LGPRIALGDNKYWTVLRAKCCDRRKSMNRGWLLLVLTAWGMFVPCHAQGEEFDRLEGAELAELTHNTEAQPRQTLTVREIEALPTVLRDNRSALVIAMTGQGNYARMLLAPALRRAPESSDKPVPVLVLERFEVFDASNKSSRLARGK